MSIRPKKILINSRNITFIAVLCFIITCKPLINEPSENKKGKIAYQYFFIENPTKSIPVVYESITQNNLKDLLSSDGIPNSMINSIMSSYVHKITINAGGGYYTNTKLKILLDQIPKTGVAKGISDDRELRRTQIGTDPSLNNLLKFNYLGWIDVKQYTNAKSLYFILDSKWGDKIDTYIYYWFGTTNRVDNISYELLDEYDDDLGSITILCYEIL